MAMPQSDDEAITSELPEERSRNVDSLEPAAAANEVGVGLVGERGAKEGGTTGAGPSGCRPFAYAVVVTAPGDETGRST
jgi:hypothetical protein